MKTVRAGRGNVLGHPARRELASARTKRAGWMNGFIAIRRGLLEHLRRGKLTESEALTFIIILGLANPYTGIWWGSAKSLWGEYPFYGNERRARRALEGLASKWYIKRLSTPGKHSNYPILIDKYEVKVGAKIGLRLNARKSKNENSLCYEVPNARQGEGELGVIPVGEQLVMGRVYRASEADLKAASSPPLLKNKKENEKKKINNTTQASPSLFDAFWSNYPKKVGKPAALRAWNKVRGSEIPDIRDGLNQWKATEQWQKESGKFIPYPATFLNQRRWEDDPPATEHSTESAIGRGPQPESEKKVGKCSKCGKDTVPGLAMCYQCLTPHWRKQAPVNP